MTPVSTFLRAFKEYSENDSYVHTESWLQKQQREKKAKQKVNEENLKKSIEQCKSFFAKLEIHYHDFPDYFGTLAYCESFFL